MKMRGEKKGQKRWDCVDHNMVVLKVHYRNGVLIGCVRGYVRRCVDVLCR